MQARPLLALALEDRDFSSLVDARLQNNYDVTEMSRMIACAAVSVRHLARRRPSMSQVLLTFHVISRIAFNHKDENSCISLMFGERWSWQNVRVRQIGSGQTKHFLFPKS